MTALTAKFGSQKTGFSSTSGASDIDIFIKGASASAFCHFRESFTNKTPQDLLNEEVLQVYGDCCRDNWDGYEARSISKNSLLGVQEFISKVDSLPVPEVNAHPDGELALDWYGDNGEIFSLSFGDLGKVSFAGRFEEGSVIHGRENVGGMDTAFVESLIRRVFHTEK